MATVPNTAAQPTPSYPWGPKQYGAATQGGAGLIGAYFGYKAAASAESSNVDAIRAEARENRRRAALAFRQGKGASIAKMGGAGIQQSSGTARAYLKAIGREHRRNLSWITRQEHSAINTARDAGSSAKTGAILGGIQSAGSAYSMGAT